MKEHGNDLGRKMMAIKEKIKTLMEEGRLEEAESALASYEGVVPRDQDLYSMKGVLFMMGGRRGEAIQVLEEGLRKMPRDFDLLFNLGYLLEQEGEILGAFDLYRQAEYSALTQSQSRDLRERVIAVKAVMKSQINLADKSFQISLAAGKKKYSFYYALEEMKIQKQVLDIVLEELHPEARTLLEIQCGPGVITRNLSACGLEATGIDTHNGEVLRAVALEIPEQARLKDRIAINPFYSISALDKHLEGIPRCHVFILSPSSFNWYASRPPGETLEILRSLSEKAGQQLFIYLPPAGGKDKKTRKEIISRLPELAAVRCTPKGSSPPGKVFPGEPPTGRGRGEGEPLPGDLYRVSRGKEPREQREPQHIIPRGIASRNSPGDILEVELEKCRDLQHFSYAPEGWHPFREVLREHLQNPGLTYDSSFLKTFFHRFQPRNRQEQLLEGERGRLKPLSLGWPDYPWYPGAGRIPQRYLTDLMQERGGNQHFGPNSREFGEIEYRRIINTYRMMEEYGYQPEIFPDGYVTGYLLVWGNDYRFVVREGQHRMPAISLLGPRVLRCRLDKQGLSPRTVDLKDIDDWPQVKSGLYPREVARRLFLKFFQENGREKARRLGLV